MVLKIILSATAGAAFGYGYHRVVGCSSGACPLTSNPYIATIWGALMGALLVMGR